MILQGYFIIGWVIRLVMIPIVARRHDPEVAMAWLAPIFLFPIIGSVLYFWLGQFGLNRNEERHRHVREVVETDDRVRDQEAHEIQFAAAPEHRDLVRLAEKLSTKDLGGFPILGGNSVDVLDEPGQAVDRLIGDLDAAENHAHLLFFQFIPDETGHKVADALIRASERGVDCRLLVDAWASRKMRKKLKPQLQAKGVAVHPVLPMHPLREPLARFDVRNHRKVAVIDGRIAYTGSTNIHEPDYDLDEGIWHQISVRVEGPAAMQLQMVFVEDWYFATDEVLHGDNIFPVPKRAGEVPVQTVPGGPSYSAHILQHVFVQAVGEANQRLIITTPYFISRPAAAPRAAARGAARRRDSPDHSRGKRPHPRRPGGARVLRGVAQGRGADPPSPQRDSARQDHVHRQRLRDDRHRQLRPALDVPQLRDILLIYSSGCTERLREKQLQLLRQSDRVHQAAWEQRPKHEQYLQHTAKLLSPVL